MESQEKKPSLIQDRSAALELLRLQEAAQLSEDEFAIRLRTQQMSYAVFASFNLYQFLIAFSGEIFHHLHHEINRRIREFDLSMPRIPEEKNPIFYIYPTCMGISAMLFFLMLTTDLLNCSPTLIMLLNGIGGILMIIGGLATMRHTEMHIDLDKISDEKLLMHPVFIHNFIMCVISICGSVLYFVPTWILYDLSNQKKHQIAKSAQARLLRRKCQCPCPKIQRRPVPSEQNCNSFVESRKKNVQDSPIDLHCCCIDWCLFIKSSNLEEIGFHEFQVIQVM